MPAQYRGAVVQHNLFLCDIFVTRVERAKYSQTTIMPGDHWNDNLVTSGLSLEEDERRVTGTSDDGSQDHITRVNVSVTKGKDFFQASTDEKSKKWFILKRLMFDDVGPQFPPLQRVSKFTASGPPLAVRVTKGMRRSCKREDFTAHLGFPGEGPITMLSANVTAV
jgi:hypothetical protein